MSPLEMYCRLRNEEKGSRREIDDVVAVEDLLTQERKDLVLIGCYSTRVAVVGRMTDHGPPAAATELLLPS